MTHAAINLCLRDYREPNRIVAQVIEQVAHAWGTSRTQILKAGRKTSVTEARQIVCHLLRRVSDLTYTDIGDAINRDHTTVLHADRSIRRRMQVDPDLHRMVMHQLQQLERRGIHARRGLLPDTLPPAREASTVAA